MREIENKLPDNPEQEVVIPAKTETQFIASSMRKNGHSIFEFNLQTGEIKQAEFKEPVWIMEKVYINFTEISRPALHRKVITKPGCYYVSALNLKNAIRHFDRWKKETLEKIAKSKKV